MPTVSVCPLIKLHYMLHSKEEWEPHSGANSLHTHRASATTQCACTCNAPCPPIVHGVHCLNNVHTSMQITSILQNICKLHLLTVHGVHCLHDVLEVAVAQVRHHLHAGLGHTRAQPEERDRAAGWAGQSQPAHVMASIGFSWHIKTACMQEVRHQLYSRLGHTRAQPGRQQQKHSRTRRRQSQPAQVVAGISYEKAYTQVAACLTMETVKSNSVVNKQQRSGDAAAKEACLGCCSAWQGIL
jgi:hypothetical protein